ncbi:MAG: glycosyltransferase [Saprospiraceae bacterium]|nr:glycosyltransferase [Saprospiraceae bacterium]
MKNIVFVIPVFNDWESCRQLLIELQARHPLSMRVLLVNDGSETDLPIDFLELKIALEILNLTLNVGHQRAIAIGLAYVHEHFDHFEMVIVMDCDGEDRPIDTDFLFDRCRQNNFQKIIFAQRKRRTESILFRSFTFLLKLFLRLFDLETQLSFGNFSCIPKDLLKK